MQLDFSGYKISVALVPGDMRQGYFSLCTVAKALLQIDVDKGEDMVVFISKRRKVAKVICRDAKGPIMLIRYLDLGCFQRLLGRNGGKAVESISREELMLYLDGGQLQVKREGFFII